MRTFRLVNIGGEERRISLKLIEPYKSIVQHGGMLSMVTLFTVYR